MDVSCLRLGKKRHSLRSPHSPLSCRIVTIGDEVNEQPTVPEDGTVRLVPRLGAKTLLKPPPYRRDTALRGIIGAECCYLRYLHRYVRWCHQKERKAGLTAHNIMLTTARYFRPNMP